MGVGEARGRGIGREKGARLPPHAGRRNKQTEERETAERDIENKEGGGDRQEISKTILV